MGPVRTHAALLRGVNVGGRNRVAMADLRALVAGLGPTEVGTYIQSGNVVLASDEADPDGLADRLEAEIAGSLGVACGVVVVPRAGLAAAVAGDPYGAEPDDRRVHLVFRRLPLSADEVASVEAAAGRAGAKGSRDEVTASLGSRVLYLWTPDGMGRSELAAQLSRTAGWQAGTARNRATALKLLALLEE